MHRNDVCITSWVSIHLFLFCKFDKSSAMLASYCRYYWHIAELETMQNASQKLHENGRTWMCNWSLLSGVTE